MPFPFTPILGDPKPAASPVWAVKLGEAFPFPAPQGLSGSWLHPRSKSGLRGVSAETWQPPSLPGAHSVPGRGPLPPWPPTQFVLPEGQGQFSWLASKSRQFPEEASVAELETGGAQTTCLSPAVSVSLSGSGSLSGPVTGPAMAAGDPETDPSLSSRPRQWGSLFTAQKHPVEG